MLNHHHTNPGTFPLHHQPGAAGNGHKGTNTDSTGTESGAQGMQESYAAQVGPGASSFAVPLLAVSGTPHFWKDRWDGLGRVLAQAEYCEEPQSKRRDDLARLEQDLAGSTDPQREEAYRCAIRTLVEKSQPPVRPPELRDQLWACACEFGLVLVHGAPNDVLGAVGSREAVLLIGISAGDIAVHLDAAAAFLEDQQAYYSWAAERVGVLFRFPSAEEMDLVCPQQ